MPNLKELITIHLKSKQIQGDCTQTIEQDFVGSYYAKGESHYFFYHDPEEQRVMIKIKQDTLTLTKAGSQDWLHIFRPGQTAVSRYGTGFGKLALEITTEDLYFSQAEAGWGIDLSYSLFASDEEPIKIALNFTIKRGV